MTTYDLTDPRLAEGVNRLLAAIDALPDETPAAHPGFHQVPACELHRGDRLLIAVDADGQPLTVCPVLGACVHGDVVEVAVPGLGWVPHFAPSMTVEVQDEQPGGAS